MIIENSRNHNEIGRTLVVLNLLAEMSVNSDVDLEDLVRASGYQQSTVQELLGTLQAHGLALKGDKRGAYRPGEEFIALGAQAIGSHTVREHKQAS